MSLVEAYNLLDITNMFSEISHDACCLQLHSHPKLKLILPYFDILYESSNTRWYKSAESGGFMVLVFSMILGNMNEEH